MCEMCPRPLRTWSKIDNDAVQQVCDMVGIRRPLTVQTGCKDPTVNGEYLAGDFVDTGEHVVTLCPNLDPVKANESCLHEIGHALDLDLSVRNGIAAEDRCRAMTRDEMVYGYNASPHEQFARMFAEEMLRRGVRVVS
jgi:hypothetical protein